MSDLSITDRRQFIIEHWGNAGHSVLAACANHPGFSMPFSEFLTHCTACGGNWGGMLLSGIRELFPDVWDAIPDEMGIYAFGLICDVLCILGISTEE